ncbi:Transcription factor Adf-1 [Lucilia cuprina]|nr:Transcription factor Adf-1 [Lucilia cuprina]
MSFVMGSEELSGTSLSGISNSASLALHHTSNNMKSTKTQRGGISESSTTSDNTTDFIEIVKKHQIVYNTHHPDYKNVEVKLKVWSQIAEEIGLSVDASKRKWKNLRDSYTKYLRSFRVGTKTSKKYQFWAHAEHMDFLKPYQGPGRSNSNATITKDEDDTECDLGYQVLSKATANTADEEELKQNSTSNIVLKNAPINTATIANMLPNYTANNTKTSTIGLTIPSANAVTASTGTSSTISGTIMLPVPSLPTVQLPPSLTAKPILASIPTSTNNITSTATNSSSSASLANTSHSYSTPASMTATSLPSQVFALPQLSAKGPIPMPSSNTASSEFNNTSSSVYSSSSTAQITPSGLQIYPNVSNNSQTMANRLTSPLITKIRRVQPSPQSSAINLSFSTAPSASATSATSALSSYPTNGYSSLTNSFMPSLGGATTITATTATNGLGSGSTAAGPPPIKKLKSAEVDISAILQANRDLDANTLFFLSLARSVRSMPTKFQSLAKMRCMRIVSDIEMELDSVSNEANGESNNLNNKYCTNNTDAPPTAGVINNVNETPLSEHFVYVMSPSRVESMIDLSSDDENPGNSGN